MRGWEAVREAGTRAATQIADGEAFTVELVSTYATMDLAYELEIHRFRRGWVAPTKRHRCPPRDDHLPAARMTAGGSSIAMPIPSRASGRSSQSRSLSPVIEVSALSGRMPMHVLAYLRRILRLLIHGVALVTAVRVSWSIAPALAEDEDDGVGGPGR